MSDGDAGARAAIGRIGGVFGLRGEVKVRGADPAELRSGLAVLALIAHQGERSLVVRSTRDHSGALLVGFEGIDDPQAAAALNGAILLAAQTDLPPLPEGTYRDEQLVGMQVVDARLGSLGGVQRVLHYPHADMLEVGPRSMLVPMLAAYEMRIDATSRTITTRLPDGFEDL